MLSLSTAQNEIHAALAGLFQEKVPQAHAIHPSYGRLIEEIERVVMNGGKRLRPYLVYIGNGAINAHATRVGVAHELLHAALLVHDDIIDRDDIRHGQPTIHHAYFAHHYQKVISDDTERIHFSRSAALLAGDLLISWAYELLGQLPQSSALIARISQGIFEVAGGELLDTESPFIPEVRDPLVIYRYKTAGYSFIAPLLSGAELQGLSGEDIKALETYASSLGVAYQIQDDLLGTFGDTEITGKSSVNDLREGKYTLLITYFLEVANDEQVALYKNVFGNTAATQEEIDSLKMAIDASGAKNRTIEELHRHIEIARNQLDLLTQDSQREALGELIDLICKRSS